MMYPFLTLYDNTEIVHSEMKPDGRVKVYVEKPDDEDFFHNAVCWIPGYQWEDNHGFTQEEIAYYEEVIRSTAHLILEFSQRGGFANAFQRKKREEKTSMNNLGTQPLQTERLLLRRFQPEDAQAMFDNWASDPEVTKFLTWPPYQSPEDVRRYLTNLAGEYRQEDRYTWAIVLRELGQPIGSISVAHQDLRVNSVEVGYCVGRAWWGQGIMTEAFPAVLDFLFDQVGVNRVTAQHDPENPASGRVMAKCGLRKEGVLRQSARCNLGVRDVACWGILRSDRPVGKQLV